MSTKKDVPLRVGTSFFHKLSEAVIPGAPGLAVGGFRCEPSLLAFAMLEAWELGFTFSGINGTWLKSKTPGLEKRETWGTRIDSVHLHARHIGVVHVVVSMIVVFRGPDLLRISLVRVHVHHPSENVGIEFSARGLAGFFGRDRAQQPELRMR